jgi:hypothetical protein
LEELHRKNGRNQSEEEKGGNTIKKKHGNVFWERVDANKQFIKRIRSLTTGNFVCLFLFFISVIASVKLSVFLFEERAVYSVLYHVD